MNQAPAHDERFMSRALELARLGIHYAAPNPMVGAVIVHDGRIIGEGFHEKYGEAHAERRAVDSVKDEDKRLLSKSTLYVNLEPCSHFGKTPPCADMILEHGIPRVVVGTLDVNKKVAGNGVRRLEEHGVRVTLGVLEKECRILNKRFFTFHTERRPYVILKWAETKDGFIARSDYSSKWISGKEARALVHTWRSEEAAVLVGTSTAIKDNPELTVRHVPGRNPVRAVIDRKLSIPPSHHLFDKSAATIILNEQIEKQDGNLRYLQCSFEKDAAKSILTKLGDQKLSSVLIEGGSKTLNSFIESGLWDEARIFVCKQSFGAGISAPELPRGGVNPVMVGDDELYVIERTSAAEK